MLTKYAFFSGTLKPGCEIEMQRFIEDKLAPLWRQFQPSVKVRILYGHEQEPHGPNIPLALEVTYQDEQSMAQAMESEARYEAREILPELYERFFEQVNLWHYVFKSD